MMMNSTRRDFLKTSAAAIAGLTASPSGFCSESSKRPNFVVIYLDDSGWADFKPFGKPVYDTPNVNQLAKDGCRFNNFYVTQAVCSASRASLLSGCYPGRTKVFGALGPKARGLDPSYATIGEALQTAGYKTAVFGKWHIGDQPDTRPPARGFDESCGLMYSNDMWEFHPENPEHWGKFPLHFWENGQVTVERVKPEHQCHLTSWYTEHAVDFIQRHKDAPFFLYVPHSMPHVPLFCSDKFKGKSGVGLFGDVMMEIDWSVGQIVKALQDNGLEDNTMVIFSSDNGPWISYGNHAGSTPFREAKGTTFDGGIRSACIAKYPGKIKAGSSSNQTFCTIDILPTLAKLAGATLPDNPIDGKDVWDIIANKPGAKNPHRYYPFSNGGNFQGVISGDGHWKLHLPHSYRTLMKAGLDGAAGKYENLKTELALFDMRTDPFETINVIDQYPKIAQRLRGYAEDHKKKFYPNQK